MFGSLFRAAIPPSVHPILQLVRRIRTLSFRGTIADYLLFSSLLNKPAEKILSIKTCHVAACPRNAQLEQFSQETENPELFQQSKADIRQYEGWTSVMFAIHRMSFGWSPHTYPLSAFRSPDILLHRVICSPRISCCDWPSPFAIIFLSCWLIHAYVPAIGLLAASCHLALPFIECHFISPQMPINSPLAAGRSPHASSLSAFGHLFLPFATLNSILRPACHTLTTSRQARPEATASGSSTRRTTASHTAWHDHARIISACNDRNEDTLDAGHPAGTTG